MDTDFSSQIIGRLGLLTSEVLDHNCELEVTIRDIQGTSQSKVELFYRVNQLLPIIFDGKFVHCQCV